MKFIAIIPARYASSRFPGKPLAMIGDKPMIQHVYEQAKKAVEDVVVATDDSRIYDRVIGFGGRAVMTSSSHKTGTDRCYEALSLQSSKYDVVINVQGDEPFIQPEQISALMECFSYPDTDIATLVKPFPQTCSYEDIANPNSPKVVLNNKGQALYFSRSVIPYIRSAEPKDWPSLHTYYKHIGIYAYRSEVLEQITQMEQTPLEKAESLEQLRWLENGFCIRTAVSDFENCGIDTPEDLQLANEVYRLKKRNE